MPTSTSETLLGRYHYDPLDRQVDCTPFDQAAIRRYYCKTRLSTEIQGTEQRTIVQHEEQLLAQQQREGGKVAATLLATDQQRSVLNALDSTPPNPIAYTPYGHRPMENGLLSLLGFNGERPDPVTGHYHLGNGYRQFNPVLMRFNSPDSWSPFGDGGLNAYMYCAGEPINRYDPAGHSWIKGTLNLLGRTPSVNSATKSIDKTIALTSKKLANANKSLTKAQNSLNREPMIQRNPKAPDFRKIHADLLKESKHIKENSPPGGFNNLDEAFNYNKGQIIIEKIERVSNIKLEISKLSQSNNDLQFTQKILLNLKAKHPETFKEWNTNQNLINAIRQNM